MLFLRCHVLLVDPPRELRAHVGNDLTLADGRVDTVAAGGQEKGSSEDDVNEHFLLELGKPGSTFYTKVEAKYGSHAKSAFATANAAYAATLSYDAFYWLQSSVLTKCKLVEPSFNTARRPCKCSRNNSSNQFVSRKLTVRIKNGFSL